MYLSGLRAAGSRRLLTESGLPTTDPIGTTISGKTIQGTGHPDYNDEVNGGARGRMAVLSALHPKGPGPAVAGSLLITRLPDWTANDHNEASRQHALMAREADEHHEIFHGMHGDGADLSPDDRERLRQMLAQLKSAAEAHRGIAAAHLHAAKLVQG